MDDLKTPKEPSDKLTKNDYNDSLLDKNLLLFEEQKSQSEAAHKVEVPTGAANANLKTREKSEQSELSQALSGMMPPKSYLKSTNRKSVNTSLMKRQQSALRPATAKNLTRVMDGHAIPIRDHHSQVMAKEFG